MDAYFKPVLPFLKRKAKGSVLIFRRKDGRELYDDDARLVADKLLMSDVALKTYQLKDRELSVLTLNKLQLTRVIRDLLLTLRCRVEVYDESDGDIFLAQQGDLTNYDAFRDIVESSVELGELSTVMAIRLVGRDSPEDNSVVVALCNPHTSRIVIGEFKDTSNFYYLSECIQNHVPRECIIFKSDEEQRPTLIKNLRIALNRGNVPHFTVPDVDISEVSLDDQKAAFISLLFKRGTSSQSSSFSANVIQTAYPLIKRMDLLTSGLEKFFVVEYECAGHLHLDSAAVRALELFALVRDDEDETSSRGYGTLYDHLNKCRSDIGRRLLRSWLRRPLCDRRRIEERLDVVEALVDNHSCRDTLHNSLLRQIPDIGVIERRFLQQKASLADCYRVYRLVNLLHSFDAVISSLANELPEDRAASVNALLAEPTKKALTEFGRFTSMIDELVDVDYAEETGTYRIKPATNPELAACWEKVKVFEKKANKQLAAINERAGLDSIKLDTKAEGGFVFRALLKDEKVISKLRVEVIDVNKGSGIRFTTTELARITADAQDVHSTYNALQEAITKELMTIAQEFIAKLEPLGDLLAVIDVLCAFAVVTANSPTSYIRPELLDKGTGVLQLEQCRHPVIECKGDVSYIPNDVKLTNNDPSNSARFAVVTGANMGGKSTYLRSAALTVIMAQVGCFVPCDAATISVVDGIHTRVGASDFQCNGVSTFMAEMVDVVAILDAAKSTSLVLIDELGRGTSTYDGFGMAWGVATHLLTKIGCICVFATHYHEMSMLKEKFPTEVVNLKVQTDAAEDGSITLLYKIVEGLAERSFGINIARCVEFPEHVIKEAEKILGFLETNSWEYTEEVNKASDMPDTEAIDAAVEELKDLADIKDIDELRAAVQRILPAGM